MLENVDCENPVKRSIHRLDALLNVTHQDPNARIALPNPFRQLWPELQRRVVLVDEILVGDVRSESSAYFERSAVASGAFRNREAVVDHFDDSIAFRQHLEPVIHEVFAYSPLLRRQCRDCLGPDRRAGASSRGHRSVQNSNTVSAASAVAAEIHAPIMNARGRYSKTTT